MKTFQHMQKRGVILSDCARAGFYDRLEKRLFDLAVRQGSIRLHNESLAARAKAESIRQASRLNPSVT